MGASMVKWIKIMLRYTKIMIVLVKGLKVVAKCCLSWVFFILISNVVLNTQMQNIEFKTSKLIIKSDIQKQIIEYGFER